MTTPILGNLTVPWTAPQGCSTAVGQCSVCGLAWLGQRCPGGATVQDDASCWPPRTRNVPTPSPLGAWGVYSPGIQCPGGYTTACTHDGSLPRGDFSFVWPPMQTETAVGCCPIGFDCARLDSDPQSQTCTRILTTGSFASVTCDQGTTVNLFTKPVPFEFISNSSTFTVPSMQFQAPLIQMVYQSTDLSTSLPLLTATRPTGSSSVQGVVPLSSLFPLETGTSTSESESSSSWSSSSGLSTGAVAGIAVGSTLVAVATLGVIIFALCHRRKHRKQQQQQPPHRYPAPGVQPGAPYQPSSYYGSPVEGPVSEVGTPWSQHSRRLSEVLFPPPLVKRAELPAHVPMDELDSKRLSIAESAVICTKMREY